MKRFLTLAAATIGLLATQKSSAQDIHFSQFYENAILRNPGLTGIFSGDYKVGLNYRSQWGSISNPFQTVLASYESRFIVNRDQGDYLSYGICFSYDHAGSINFNSLQVYPAINYNKSLEDDHQSYLSAGFTAGYIQRSVDATKMTLDNQYIAGQYSASNPTGETIDFSRVSHFDLGAGVSFNSTAGNRKQVNYYFGGAAYHVTKPKEAFDNSAFIRLNTRFTGNLGIRWRITDEYGVIFHANYTNQSPYAETILGGLVSWRPPAGSVSGNMKTFSAYAGAFYRFKDAVIPTLKIDYKTYSFTASYDVTTSSLRPVGSGKGGWEFSIYARGESKKVANQNACPHFESDLSGQEY